MRLMRIWYDPPRVRWRRGGLYFGVGSVPGAARVPLRRGPWPAGPAREREVDAAQAAAAETLRASSRERLVALAAGSRDALVQAYALQACRAAGVVASCQGVSPEAWARLEPDNAAPWLAIAESPRT